MFIVHRRTTIVVAVTVAVTALSLTSIKVKVDDGIECIYVVSPRRVVGACIICIIIPAKVCIHWHGVSGVVTGVTITPSMNIGHGLIGVRIVGHICR